MAKTRSIARNENHNASSKKRYKTCWSDVNYDVLFLVMMQLRVVDFVAFSGVCKSWRSLALSNRNKFMVSRPPISIRISTDDDESDYFSYLKDFEGTTFKTIIPHSGGKIYVGFTYGYLVFFGRKTRDIWLVNPITRHELHFPVIPFSESYNPQFSTAILVFSPSIYGLVFVVLFRFTKKILFCIASTTQAWNYVTSTFNLLDLCAFKGKIYTRDNVYGLFEMRLDPNPKLTLLETKNNLKPNLCNAFERLHESFYVVSKVRYPYNVLEGMKWVSPKKPIEEYVYSIKPKA